MMIVRARRAGGNPYPVRAILAGAFVLAIGTVAAGLGAGTPVMAADWASVVMYHRFGEDRHPSTNIRIEQFEAHLAELSSGGYTVLALPEIVEAMKTGGILPDRTVAITIDDAYISTYTEAWPRLKAAGLPFTLFVATNAVDESNSAYMSWEQIRELVADGVAIGSQTAAHPHMPNLSGQRNMQEIRQSNERFEAELGAAPRLFAYPYGEYSAAVRNIVIESGFAAAFGQQSGVAYAGADMFALPRFAMNENYGDIARLRLAANAMPLRVADVTPADNMLRKHNPPAFGFTVVEALSRLNSLACFASNQSTPTRLERLGERRFEVRLDRAFPPGRGRINCTMPAPGKRWRWFGTQFYIPKN